MRKRSSIIILMAGFLAISAFSSSAGDLNFKLRPLEGKKKVELAKMLETGPVLVAFWATWCHPCQEELLQLQKIYDVYRDSGLGFFAVSIDDAKTASKVKTVASGKRITMPVLLDPEQEAMQAFGLANVPGVFILGRGGEMLYRHIGYKPGDEAGLEENIKAIVSGLKRPQDCPSPDSSAISDTVGTAGKEDK